jgi:hypothetical protein
MYSKVILSIVFAALLGYATACDVKATSYTTEGKKNYKIKKNVKFNDFFVIIR